MVDSSSSTEIPQNQSSRGEIREPVRVPELIYILTSQLQKLTAEEGGEVINLRTS